MGIYGLRSDLAHAERVRRDAAKRRLNINWCLINMRVERMQVAEWQHNPIGLPPLEMY